MLNSIILTAYCALFYHVTATANHFLPRRQVETALQMLLQHQTAVCSADDTT